MKVMILGAAGMLGHKMLRTFQDAEAQAGFETWATLRKSKSHYSDWAFLQGPRILGDVDVTTPQLFDVLDQVKPQWVINCVGLTLRKKQATDHRANIQLNALLPHQIDYWCRKNRTKLVHYSTDCVFNGKLGNYNESSEKDACDVYGQSKSLGEVITSPNALTFRSSIIGREIENRTELVEWFLSQVGKTIKGYERAMYSGVTTNFMSEITLRVIREKPQLHGLYQLGSQPISKLNLLRMIREKMNLPIEIIPDQNVQVNHTLTADKFKKDTGWVIPSWDEMIDQLVKDAGFYTRGAK